MYVWHSLHTSKHVNYVHCPMPAQCLPTARLPSHSDAILQLLLCLELLQLAPIGLTVVSPAWSTQDGVASRAA